MNNQQLTAIVLAGGQSSRMGRDKALISVQGTPLIRRVCEVALGCTSQVYVVTPWIERYQEILPENCQIVLEVALTAENKPHGPLIGFYQGLAQVKTEWILLLACDLPYLQLPVLQDAINQLNKVAFANNEENKILGKNSDNFIALLPRNPKGWEPLCGFYQRSCLPNLAEFIDRGGRSFQEWLAQNPVKELQLSNSEILFNCNTPTDLANIRPCL